MDFSKISIIPIFLPFMDQIINQLIQRIAGRLIYKYNHLKIPAIGLIVDLRSGRFNQEPLTYQQC